MVAPVQMISTRSTSSCDVPPTSTSSLVLSEKVSKVSSGILWQNYDLGRNAKRNSKYKIEAYQPTTRVQTSFSHFQEKLLKEVEARSAPLNIQVFGEVSAWQNAILWHNASVEDIRRYKMLMQVCDAWEKSSDPSRREFVVSLLADGFQGCRNSLNEAIRRLFSALVALPLMVRRSSSEIVEAFVCDLVRFREDIAQKIFFQRADQDCIKDGGPVIDVIEMEFEYPKPLISVRPALYEVIPSPLKALTDVFAQFVPAAPTVIPAIVASYISFGPVNRAFCSEYKNPQMIFKLFRRVLAPEPGETYCFQSSQFQEWLRLMGVASINTAIKDPKWSLAFLVENEFLVKKVDSTSSRSF